MQYRSVLRRAAMVLALSSISLYSATAQAQSFNKSSLAGAALDAPTALQFGPDGRLYVTERYGLIRIYTISRAGATSYSVTATETLSSIQDTTNHNDDGTVNLSENTRQTTGMFVAGTDTNPVLYVTHSDPRVAVGNDSGLDTNSGTLTRLTWNGSSWDRLDLVRGLPRNEENHSTNGVFLDAATNILYIAQGGHTNMGAPSNNFAFQREYALSAAILSVDLTAIGESTYELPTLDDPSRSNEIRMFNGTMQEVDVNDPWGGNNGNNQAVMVPGGPVQVYSPGFRNAYDVWVTADGRMYTIDNGPNSGWGGPPISCTLTNNDNESRSYNDALHYIGNVNTYVAGSYYGGHPNTVRADRNNTFNGVSPIPVGMENPIECVYERPFGEGNPPAAPHDQLDQSLWSWNSSTNGLSEYTASNFGGAMQGDLLAATYNGQSIERIQLNEAGDDITTVSTLFSNVGGNQLDVIAQGDFDIFPGTIWAAGFAQDKITVFEPDDFSVCTGLYDTMLDEDGDGFSNADEIDNGTDPCSNGSVPADNDNDGLSDLNDTDDDNDGIDDELDAFAIDAFNGLNTALPVAYEWGVGEPGFGLLGLGFTGLLTNGTDNYQDQFIPENMTPGGAAGIFTIDVIDAGDAYQSNNSQNNGFQFGVNVSQATGTFEVSTALTPPFFGGATPSNFQSLGLQIGAGDQDNLVKLVMNASGGAGGIQLQHENAGIAAGQDFDDADYGATILAATSVELVLTIDPVAGTVSASASISGAPRVDLGTPIALAGDVLDRVQGSAALAVGLISTSFNSGTNFAGSWDYLRVNAVASTASALVRIDPGGDGIDNSTYGNGSFQIANTSTGGELITDVSIDLGTAAFPDMVFDPDGTAGDATAKGFTVNSEGGTSVSGHSFASPENGVDGDDGYEVLDITFADFNAGESMNFSIDNDPTSIKGGSAPGPNDSGSVSGAELTGSTVTVTFSDGTVLTSETVYDGSTVDASEAVVASAPPPAPSLLAVGIGSGAAEVISASQTIRVTGPAGASGELMHASGGLYVNGNTGSFPNGYDIEPFETNSLSSISAIPFTIGGGGTVDVPVILTRFEGDGGYTPGAADQLGHNTFVAAIDDGAGRFGLVSDPVLLQFVDADVTLSTTGLAFGDVPVGDIATNTLSITNTTGGPLDITALSVTGDPPFGIDSPPALPATILAGASLDLTIRFAPESTGSELGSIQITHTGNNSPQIVTLDGTGVLNAGDVLFRVNNGGPLVSSIDSGPDWAVDTNAAPSSFRVAGGGNAGAYNVTPGITVPSNIPALVFQTERWDPGAAPEMQWEFPVGADASVEVRLYMGNGFNGTSAAGARVFSVNIEGADAFGSIDLSGSLGHQVGGLFSYNTTVGADGILDIDFIHNIENPLVNAIEILGAGTTAGPDLTPDPTSLAYGLVQTGSSSTETLVTLTNLGDEDVTVTGLSFNGSDAGEFAVTMSPAIPSIVMPGNSVQVGVTFSPTSDGAKSADLEITTAELGAPVSIPLSGEGVTTGMPVVLYRVNAGGIEIADTPIPWSEDREIAAGSTGGNATEGTPSPYVNVGGISAADSKVYGTTDTVTANASVPAGTPAAIFTTERWDPPSVPEMEWDFPVIAGRTVEVRLYMAEIFLTASGDRQMDIFVEGALFQDNLDPHLVAGHDVGFMVSTTAVSDGNIDVDFVHVLDNPNVKAIEIIDISGVGTPAAAATPGTLDLGSALAGSIAGPDTVTLTNSGDVDLTLTGLTLTGADAASFTIDSAPGLPLTLLPGEQALVDISYTPAASGADAATLAATFTELPADLEVPLSGAGVEQTFGEVVYRINAGGPQIAAADATAPDWSADTSGAPSPFNNSGVNNNTFSTADPITFDPSVAPSAPAALFQTERYINLDDASETSLEWDLPVTAGLEVEVRLYLAEIFLDSANNGTNGPRIMDISVEGTILADDLDQFALFGHDVGFMLATTVVSDGNIDIDLLSVAQNPAIKGLEIVTGGGSFVLSSQNTIVPITANASAPLNTVSNTLLASDGSSRTVGLTGKDDLTGLEPTWLTFPTAATTGIPFDLDVDASSLATGVYTATLTATSTGADPVDFMVQLIVNGGSSSAPLANDDSFTALDGQPVNLDVLANDTDDGFPANPVVSTVLIASQPGQGTASANLDGSVQYTYTGATLVAGTTDTFTYTLTDSGGLTSPPATVTVTVSPYVSDAAAMLAVNDGQPIGPSTSTYTANAFQLTNNSGSGQLIEFIELDLSTAAMIDLIFDPDGKAGDAVGKGLVVDTNPGVGIITSQFLDFNNGIDDDDGFDRIRIEFTDFGPGKTLGFSTDIDPNSIKTFDGSGLAGAVMGLEIVGTRVTVGFSDGRVRQGNLYGNGLSGESSVSLAEIEPPAPTLELVGGMGLQRLNVAQNTQTFRVYAPEGTTVRLLRFEAVLSPQGINGGLGYEVELFEANTLPSVALTSQQTGIAGPEGYAEFTEFMLASPVVPDQEPGYNHLLAIADNGSELGATSNSLIVKIGNNLPPIALDDTLKLEAGSTASVSVADNDADMDGFLNTGSVTIVSPPTSGTIVSIDPGTGAIAYTAPATGSTSDSFTYTLLDNAGTVSNEATVLVTIQCPTDLNGDGIVDNGDISVFVQLFLAGDLAADFNSDGFLDNGDIGAFVAAFLAGCA